MAVITHVLVQLSVIVVWTRAQAPGDGANLCLSAQLAKAPYPPQFPKNVVPLMDSYDYLSLLTLPPPGMDTWKVVDVDGDNHYWAQVGNKTCRQTPASCAFSYGKQNNWMVTQHINTTINGVALKESGSIVVRVNFSLYGCLASCQQSFLLKLYETPDTSATNSLNITKYATFTNSIVEISQNPTGNVSQIQDVPVPLTGKGGMYLGIQDIGSCVSINRLTIFYYVCPRQEINLIIYPVTVANGPVAKLLCTRGASAVGQQSPQASCGSLGMWGSPIGSCACSPGYTQVGQTCQSCPPGTYKSAQGSSVCLPCPSNSNSSVNGSSQCPCLQGYYRPAGSGASNGCIAEGPPSAPQNVSVDAIGTTYVVLNWYTPQDSGGTEAISYWIYYQAVNDSLRMTSGNVTATSVNVTNMHPGTEYKITVVAWNGIPGDEQKRSALITVKTQSLSTETDYTPFIIGAALGLAVLVACVILMLSACILRWRSKYGTRNGKNATAAANATWTDLSHPELTTKPSQSEYQPTPLASAAMKCTSEASKQPPQAGYYEVELSSPRTNQYQYTEPKQHLQAVLSEPYASVQPAYAEIGEPAMPYQALTATSEYQSMYAVTCNTPQPPPAYYEVPSQEPLEQACISANARLDSLYIMKAETIITALSHVRKTNCYYQRLRPRCQLTRSYDIVKMAERNKAETEPLVSFKGEGQLHVGRKRSYRTAILLLAVMVVVIAVIAVSVALGVTLTRSSTSNPVTSNTCNTEVCTSLANRVLSSLDTSIDPCQDFYNFSCGGWIKTNSLPQGKGRYGVFDELNYKNQVCSGGTS
ncbi:hypothetical protein EMCRGX_G017303 [Ephydatia muelleri]